VEGSDWVAVGEVAWDWVETGWVAAPEAMGWEVVGLAGVGLVVVLVEGGWGLEGVGSDWAEASGWVGLAEVGGQVVVDLRLVKEEAVEGLMAVAGSEALGWVEGQLAAVG